MIQWFKTSIPGIILLGAFGSILAIGLLKLAGASIRRWLRPAASSALGRAFAFVRAPHYVIDHLTKWPGDPTKLIVTCTLLLAGFVTAIELVVVGLLAAVAGASLVETGPKTHLGRFLLLWGSAGSSLGIIFMTISFSWISRLYRIYMGKAEEDALTKAKQEFRTRGPA